jgi:hypothetical protein
MSALRLQVDLPFQSESPETRGASWRYTDEPEAYSIDLVRGFVFEFPRRGDKGWGEHNKF